MQMKRMDPTDWNERCAKLPHASILQTREWGEVKRAFGWTPSHFGWEDETGNLLAAALLLERRVQLPVLPISFNIVYVPRGPLLDWGNTTLRRKVLDDLQAYARQAKAIFVKIDPELRVGDGAPGMEGASEDATGRAVEAEFESRGWVFSPDQIQFRNTALLDLTGEEEDWLARMKPKSRYNLRLAQKKGVTVRQATRDELGLIYQMYAETSVRDGFVIRSEAYYQKVWNTFADAGMLVPLLAEFDGQPLAGLMLFVFAGRAWYIYGMSRDLHRELMPNYLLQWEAMRAARARGAVAYDLWGAPEVFDDSDSMWGVFRFKEGLGARVLRTTGAWDYVTRPFIFRLYTQVLPKFLDLMRRRGKQRTRQEVGA